MMIIIVERYCPDCRSVEQMIGVIQKADLQGYTFTIRWICLSEYCNWKDTETMTYTQVYHLIGGKDEEETD